MKARTKSRVGPGAKARVIARTRNALKRAAAGKWPPPLGRTKAEDRRLMKRLTLEDTAEAANRAYLDALAVFEAARLFWEQSQVECQKARVALHNAKDALHAHNYKMFNAAGDKQVSIADPQCWIEVMARGATAVDKALKYCEQSDKRIDEMEREAKQAQTTKKRTLDRKNPANGARRS